DYSTLITVASVIAVAAIAFAYRHAAMVSPITRTALGLQVGGALGNVLDRFRHGYVVDFIDVGAWPVFNIADSAIVSGIAVLVVYFTLIHDHEGDPEYEGKKRSSQATEDPYHGDPEARQTSISSRRDADSKE
ncbi:MAG: signal peptidase II, partial [Chloroflexota bacterium]